MRLTPQFPKRKVWVGFPRSSRLVSRPLEHRTRMSTLRWSHPVRRFIAVMETRASWGLPSCQVELCTRDTCNTPEASPSVRTAAPQAPAPSPFPCEQISPSLPPPPPFILISSRSCPLIELCSLSFSSPGWI